jgi:hypothetical protein
MDAIATSVSNLGVAIVFAFLFWDFIKKYVTEQTKQTSDALKSLEIAITKLTDKLDNHLEDDGKESRDDIR